ncbi:MAG: 4Fe-4S dicluster domain-containing protein [Candidatus Kryptoniota bacterium]
MSKELAILVDTAQCIGCYACEEACADRWGFPKTETHELSSIKNTVVQDWDGIYVPRLCMHCENPTCASVCPVGAFYKTIEGPVVYDANKCIGCRYCMQACPFAVPKYQWNKPDPKVTKCDMCYDRIKAGKQPACVEACPAQARTFGLRDELLAEAHKRINQNRDKYYHHVFGEEEVGGTSVIYLSPREFSAIGFNPNLPDHALPQYTWNIMSKIPGYFFWGSTLMTGFWWLTNRKREVARLERRIKNNGNRRSSDNYPKSKK